MVTSDTRVIRPWIREAWLNPAVNMNPVFSFQVAKAIPQDSYGLVFGINTFMALALQTVLTIVVTTNAGFALTPRPQVSAEGALVVALGGST